MTMNSKEERQRRPIHIHDYRPSPWLIDSIDLCFELDGESWRAPKDDAKTRVEGRLVVRRNPDALAADRAAPLTLDGQGIDLLSLAIDSKPCAAGAYQLDDKTLRCAPEGDGEFVVEYVGLIQPRRNSSLEGLYCSRGIFCTQCEPEGFRKLGFFIDRPDILSVYSTRIIASPERFPVMLCNGNRSSAKQLEDGRHEVSWHDPFPKPSYLFALVAGALCCVERSYRTASGREVALLMYVEEKDLDKCDFALDALARAMRWDERRYGLEYDLDAYRIVAIDDFNAGAMENKGLNIFNTAFVFANSLVSSDMQCKRIESVVAHEYFHNWSGNRVTCRDWFQLTLKEGLTVFRDQQFFAEDNPELETRVPEVISLRAAQFSEDASPLAHPPRPALYFEISNFYTATVYEKGAEVVRMLHLLLGEEAFMRGARLYFQRHDGQAVTCDDFVAAMAEASGRNLDQFMLWYSQAGTPRLHVEEHYDTSSRQYRLRIAQSTLPTPGQPDKKPLHMPITLSLLDAEGAYVPLRRAGQLHGERCVLELSESAQDFIFDDLPQRPIPALLGGFSAPVKLEMERDTDVLLSLVRHEGDAFLRWDAAQSIYARAILSRAERLAQAPPPQCSGEDEFARACVEIALDLGARRRALSDLLLGMPSDHYLYSQLPDGQLADPLAIYWARLGMQRDLAHALAPRLTELMRASRCQASYDLSAEQIARRALHNRCLAWLALCEERWVIDYSVAQCQEFSNMTDVSAALAALLACGAAQPEAEAMLRFCHERWSGEPLALNVWFEQQAACRLPGALTRVRALLRHPDFDLKNPNKAYALFGAFSHRNTPHFHALDGSGYAFLSESILEIDAFNPQLGARLAQALTRWTQLQEPYRVGMIRALNELAGAQISSNLREVAESGLSAAANQ